VAYHILADENWNMLPPIMHRDSQPNHVWGNHGTTRPSFNWSLVIFLNRVLHFLHQVEINERAFF
jgi:hypothetical protein